MTSKPLTARQRTALAIVLRDGRDQWNHIQQGVWSSLQRRGLVVRCGRRYWGLTDEGAKVAQERYEQGDRAPVFK